MSYWGKISVSLYWYIIIYLFDLLYLKIKLKIFTYSDIWKTVKDGASEDLPGPLMDVHLISIKILKIAETLAHSL